MNNALSKVLIALVLIVAAVAIFLTLKLNNARNEFTKQIVALKKTAVDNAEKLRVDRTTAAAAEAELNRQMQHWGHEWPSANSGPVTGFPAVQVSVGKNQGLGLKEATLNKPLPNIYVFGSDQDGSSRYLGEFQVQELQDNQAAAALTRSPYVGEAESWPSGAFRVRDSIPPGWRTSFIDLHTQQTIADQELIDETAKLEIQNKHIAESQQTLERRLAELNGNPNAPEKASSVVKLGLVQSIRDDEAERNKLLREVDALRRALSDNYAELEKVLAENRQIVESIGLDSNAQTANRTQPVK